MSQSELPGILPALPPEEFQPTLPIDLPSVGHTVVRERDDEAEIYCSRASARMLPSIALESVLGNNVNNCNSYCNNCKNPCYG